MEALIKGLDPYCMRISLNSLYIIRCFYGSNMKIICTLHCRAVVFFPASKIMLYKYVANMHNIYHTEIFTLNQCTYKQTEIDLHTFFVKSTCVCVVQSGLSNQLPIEYNSNHWHYIYIVGRYI